MEQPTNSKRTLWYKRLAAAGLGFFMAICVSQVVHIMPNEFVWLRVQYGKFSGRVDGKDFGIAAYINGDNLYKQMPDLRSDEEILEILDVVVEQHHCIVVCRVRSFGKIPWTVETRTYVYE